jgi:hypothetical protein
MWGDVDDLGGDQAQRAVRNRGCEPVLNLRCHPVPVDVPPGARVLEKALPGAGRKLAPEPPGEGANSVDDAAPIAAFCVMGVDPVAQPAQQSAGAGRKRNFRLIDAQRLDAAMCPRQQPAARNRDDWSAMAFAQSRQNEVDHGETSAENEERRVPGDTRTGVGRPGISITGEWRVTGIVTRRKNSDVAGQPCAICKSDHDAVPTFADRDTFVVYQGEGARTSFLCDQRLDQTLDIIAKDPTRYEAIGVGGAKVARGEPAHEMIGILGQGAHIARPHVEQVIGIAGVIGETAADLRLPLDQRDPERCAAPTQQLISEQNAAGAAADDNRVPLGHAMTP